MQHWKSNHDLLHPVPYALNGCAGVERFRISQCRPFYEVEENIVPLSGPSSHQTQETLKVAGGGGL